VLISQGGVYTPLGGCK